MSTCLAEVLFGHIDRDHGGILFNHRISVYENSVARLVFEKKASRDGETGSIEGIWILNPKYFIDSCILMAAIYGTGNCSLKEKLEQHLPKNEIVFDINLCGIDENILIELFEEAKKVFCPPVYTGRGGHSLRWKFLFALFEDSSIEREIKNILDYDMDVEVLKSVYSSSFSEWTNGIVKRGEL